MAGPKIPWRPGRIDGFEQQVTPDGRLPDASQGADHLRNVSLLLANRLLRNIVIPCNQIFYRMGFNDQEIVALSGAHALGRCHTSR